MGEDDIRIRKRSIGYGFFWSLVFFILLAHPLWAAETETIKIATSEYPPYTSRFLEGNGVFCRIVSEAFSLSGLKVEYEFFPWKRALEIAGSGQADCLMAGQPSPLREKRFHFSEPVLSIHKVFFHRNDRAFDWNSLEDLKGMRIGTTRGYLYFPSFRRDAKDRGLELIDSDSDEINLGLLHKGRVDLHLNDLRTGLFLVEKLAEKKENHWLTYHPRVIAESPLAVFFPRTRSESPLLLEAFNHGLKRLKDTGQYREILQAQEGTPEITVAMAHWPPWKILGKDGFSGLDVAILGEIGKQAGLRFVFKECTWRRCIEMVKDGQADMITSFCKTPGREVYVHYFEPPYRTEKVVFF